MIDEIQIAKPRKITVPLAAGLAWRGGAGFLYQEKVDGVFAVRQWSGATLAGEQLRGGPFVAFDVLEHGGQDVWGWPLRERWALLASLRDVIVGNGGGIVATGQGGEFLEAVLAHGGEGIVAKRWDSAYGSDMFACKRLGTWICAVTGFCGGTQSVTIADAVTGRARGRLALRGGKCDQVRGGSLVKVEGYGLTAAGKIREPRVCRDSPGSWLVKF
jgi:hypothetical protein